MRYIEFKLVEKSKANKAKKKAAVKKYKTSDEELLDRYSNRTENLFTSYTVIDKVGINPRSGYNTPIGIYCYPMQYVIDLMKKGKSVPYMGEAQYIQIFAATNPERALNLQTYNDSNLKTDVEKLQKYFVSKGITAVDQFNNIVEDAKAGTYATQNKPASYIWNITRTLSIKVGSGELKESSQLLDSELLLEWEDSKPSRSVVIWNGIYRNILGYDYAIDPAGYGIIHSAEPTQAVFFSTKGLRVIDRIQNHSEVDDQLTLISRIGQDSPNKDKARARKSFEYQRLIARNLNDYSLLELRRYFDHVTSPSLQKKIAKQYPTEIVGFKNLSNSEISNIAKTQFLKTIKGGNDKKITAMLDTLSYSHGYTKKFFDLIGVGNEWPEFEKAAIEYLEKNGIYNRLHSFTTNNYLFDVKRKPWPEFEKYIDSYDYDKYTYVTGAKVNTGPKLKPGDAVKILKGEYKGKEGEVEFTYKNSKYDIVDPDTGQTFGMYHISDLEPVDSKYGTLKSLIDKGKETGYVTYNELNSVLPPDEVSSEEIEDVLSMISEIGINIIEDEPAQSEPPEAEPPKPEVKKTKGPSGKKIMQFVAQAESKGGDITQAELDSFLPPGTIKDDNLKHILELLKDQGITVDGNPIAIPGDEPVEMPAKKNFEYDGTQKLTTKEKNAWEQIMIKSENDAVVKPLLNKAFKNYSLSSSEFYTLAKNIDFPFWVAGKYLGMVGVKVDSSKIKAEYVKQNKGANPPQDY